MRNAVNRVDSSRSYRIGRRLLDATSLRTQIEVIRDVMLSAADCGTWLTLLELSELTSYGEASISAQLRNLRKPDHGGFRVEKRRRDGDGAVIVLRRHGKTSNQTAGAAALGASASYAQSETANRIAGHDPRKWEYQITRAQ